MKNQTNIFGNFAARYLHRNKTKIGRLERSRDTSNKLTFFLCFTYFLQLNCVQVDGHLIENYR